MTTRDTTTAVPLDAERARLRSAGYTDAEISHILTQREIGAAPQPAAPGAASTPGVLSGVLSSFVAVASHTRSYIVATKADLATLFGTASPAARLKAGGSLVLKAVIVAVLGYAAMQEWNRHIVYDVEIARQQALKTKTETEAISTPPLRSTADTLESSGETIRLETCRQAGIAPEKCPKF